LAGGGEGRGYQAIWRGGGELKKIVENEGTRVEKGNSHPMKGGVQNEGGGGKNQNNNGSTTQSLNRVGAVSYKNAWGGGAGIKRGRSWCEKKGPGQGGEEGRKNLGRGVDLREKGGRGTTNQSQTWAVGKEQD